MLNLLKYTDQYSFKIDTVINLHISLHWNLDKFTCLGYKWLYVEIQHKTWIYFISYRSSVI